MATVAAAQKWSPNPIDFSVDLALSLFSFNKQLFEGYFAQQIISACALSLIFVDNAKLSIWFLFDFYSRSSELLCSTDLSICHLLLISPSVFLPCVEFADCYVWFLLDFLLQIIWFGCSMLYLFDFIDIPLLFAWVTRSVVPLYSTIIAIDCIDIWFMFITHAKLVLFMIKHELSVFMFMFMFMVLIYAVRLLLISYCPTGYDLLLADQFLSLICFWFVSDCFVHVHAHCYVHLHVHAIVCCRWVLISYSD